MKYNQLLVLEKRQKHIKRPRRQCISIQLTEGSRHKPIYSEIHVQILNSLKGTRRLNGKDLYWRTIAQGLVIEKKDQRIYNGKLYKHFQ